MWRLRRIFRPAFQWVTVSAPGSNGSHLRACGRNPSFSVGDTVPWFEHTITVTATYKVWNEAVDKASAISAMRNFTGEDIKKNSVQREMLKTVSSVTVDSTVEQKNI